jgi:hypothetical protein
MEFSENVLIFVKQNANIGVNMVTVLLIRKIAGQLLK